MPYRVYCTDAATAERVAAAVPRYLARSRFRLVGNLLIERGRRRRRPVWVVVVGKMRGHMHSGLRLRRPKDFCGNHPGPCPVRAFPHPQRRSGNLEGADFVGLNDMMNDLLDELGVDADAGTTQVTVRRGRRRRVRYGQYVFAVRDGVPHHDWDREGATATTRTTSAGRRRRRRTRRALPAWQPGNRRTVVIDRRLEGDGFVTGKVPRLLRPDY